MIILKVGQLSVLKTIELLVGIVLLFKVLIDANMRVSIEDMHVISANKNEHAVYSYAAGKGRIYCNAKNAKQC